jgi:hypothetical protein
MLAALIGANGLAMTTSAQTVNVRIELLDIRCNDTEDVTGADEFFLVAAMSDGRQTRGLVTRPIDIDAGQKRTFAKDQRLFFEGNVPRGRTVKGGLIAYDEDYAKDWSKQKDMAKAITDGVAGIVAAAGEVRAAAILEAAYHAWDRIASLDTDDVLGRVELNVPAAGPSGEVLEWEFQRDDPTGYSGWSYTLRYKVTRSK